MKIAFVPLRGGSKSIPRKNIKLFCGKPLAFWCLNALQRSTSIDKIYVSTEDMEIRQIIESFDLSKITIFHRGIGTAQDHSSTEDAILEFLEASKLLPSDLFLLAQATSPFTEFKDVDNAFSLMKSDQTDSVVSCCRINRFFWNSLGESINYDFTNRPRRQDFEGTFIENGAFYISTVGAILKSGNRISGRIRLYEMESYKALELDEPEDWLTAEKLMIKHNLVNNDFPIVKLFLSDVDGTLTDASMYYGESGEELKKFNTHDGKAFEIISLFGVKTGVITTENTKIVTKRAEKLKLDYVVQGVQGIGKLAAAKKICHELGIDITNVAYIGDDINCTELLGAVGVAACPSDAVSAVKNLPNIIRLSKKGGRGCVREFIEILVKQKELS